jgi:hypothetical protein
MLPFGVPKTPGAQVARKPFEQRAGFNRHGTPG